MACGKKCVTLQQTFREQMITDELTYRVREAFGHEPTAEQEQAIRTFALFMTDRREEAVMLLRGSAGTGKTTLAAAMVRALLSLDEPSGQGVGYGSVPSRSADGHRRERLVLLAPTGRAAKVFSLYAGHAAYTIHRRIYRQRSMEGTFDLSFNGAQDTLFIVDEASMIADSAAPGESPFGGGRLLDDLIRFVYNGRGCRLMLIGDRAQLPPVGLTESPALSADVLRGYGLWPYECDLQEVLRQSHESGILFNATRIRQWGAAGGARPTVLPQVTFRGFQDIRMVPGQELIDELAGSYQQVGLDDTLVITRSNKWANVYNQGIRNRILDRDAELCAGDRLMIVKNNYYWTQQGRPSDGGREGTGLSPDGGRSGEEPRLDFIANGDLAVVRRVRHQHELYGFRFAEVTMTFPDYGDLELTAMVLLDTLTSEAPALTREQQQQLFDRVLEDYQDVPLKRDRLKRLKEDKYYNALQVKFAYAATCHKAQGGQWAHVYVDQGYMTDDMLTADYLHWLYTAFTRATERLYLVNWPATQTAR